MEKSGLKPIPPTLRGKKRYVKFELISGSALNEEAVKRAIWSVFSAIYGEKGIADQKLWLVKWEHGKNIGYLRCALETEEETKAGLLFLGRVAGEQVVPIILLVSGSMKKLRA